MKKVLFVWRYESLRQRYHQNNFLLDPKGLTSDQIKVVLVITIIENKMRNVLVFLTIFCAMLSCGHTINWQGTGNMTQDNMTAIWGYIDEHFSKGWTYEQVQASGSTILVDFAAGLSDSLTSLWARAWNVFVVYITVKEDNLDSVVYGYAFRDHWMWYNGIKMDDDYYVSFVIWKDYNCIKWWRRDDTEQITNSFTNTFEDEILYQNVQNAIQAFQSSADAKKDDIWATAQALHTALEKLSDFSGKALSVIMSQSNDAYMYGKFCAKDYMTVYPVGTLPANWGYAIMMQTR